MQIALAQLYNFRCFKDIKIEFKASLTLILGPNGSGKTSLLEALHYACYMRSFKTYAPYELIQTQKDKNLSRTGFAVHLTLESMDMLHVTFNNQRNSNKRNLKLNKKAVTSYKELYDTYKVITITEDDLQLVQGSPIIRRTFIDQLITLNNTPYLSLLKRYRHVLHNRNALLQHAYNKELYNLWSEQLFTLTKTIQEERKKNLNKLEQKANKLAHQVFSENYSLSIEYNSSRSYVVNDRFDTFEQAIDQYPDFIEQEYKQKRTLFGAHLDDYTIIFQQKSSRTYASRGQQKLIVFLLKGAQLKLVNSKAILLVDDFITDFDENKVNALMQLILTLSSQVIITSPLSSSPLVDIVKRHKGDIISISREFTLLD